jgi:outer membrane protein assembly factor BamA
MSKSQALGSLFFAIFLYSFPWVTHAQEPDNRPPTIAYRDLSFTGNRSVKPKTLKALVKAYKSVDGYDLRDTDADIERLVNFYHSVGFLDVRVAREVVFDDRCRAAKVIFHVLEGPRNPAADVTTPGGAYMVPLPQNANGRQPAVIPVEVEGR